MGSHFGNEFCADLANLGNARHCQAIPIRAKILSSKPFCIVPVLAAKAEFMRFLSIPSRSVLQVEANNRVSLIVSRIVGSGSYEEMDANRKFSLFVCSK